MSDFRTSPSGRLVTADPSVLSVFGRVGDVVAQASDYDTDKLVNASAVAGATTEDALDTLSSSDGRTNASSVPGASLTAALDFLLGAITPYVPGTLRETFAGGSETNTAASANANVGDLGWNILQGGTVVVGPTVSKLSAAGTTAFGIYRLTTPTSASGTPAGMACCLSATGASQGMLRWDQLSECTWKARFDPAPAAGNLTFLLGFIEQGVATGNLITVGFLVQISGIGGNTHYQATATNSTLGGFVFTPTTVLVDSNFHEFRLVRTDATTVTFFIDGVQVAQINNANAVPPANQDMMPVFRGTTGNSGAQTPSFVDVDDFILVPVAA